MDREILFAKTLEKVKGTAREQGGCISEEQVQEAFARLELEESQLALVYEYLRSHKIGIGEAPDMDDYLTGEEKDYIQEYLEELKLLDILSEGEKEAVALSAMAGDRDAQRRLVEIYLPEVVDVAKLYAGQGVFLEDLIGEGNVALAMGVQMLGCLERAEEVQGMLGRMMMDAMEEYIAENAEESRKDKRIAEKVNKVAEAAGELARELGRKVTQEELSAETGMTTEYIADAMRMSGYKIEELESGEQTGI